MISVICAYDKREVLESVLLPSLRRQSCQDYELITLNNRELGLTSAAQTLNAGAAKAQGEILLFAHQDVELTDERFLEKVVAFCAERDFGVAGAAGAVAAERKVYSAVVQGEEKKQAGERITAPKDVDVLDECLLIIKKKNFKTFDDLGDTWHFYAVEYSLRCRLAGESVVALPFSIYHLSPGWSLNESYWQTLKRLAKKYRGKVKVIPTTMGNYKNNALLPLEIFLRKLRKRLKESTKEKQNNGVKHGRE